MKMTLEQHRKLGEEIQQFRRAMMQHHVMNVGKIHSYENRTVQRVLKEIDRLKSDMDGVVHHDLRGTDGIGDIYYPTKRVV